MPEIVTLENGTYTEWAGFLGDEALFADAEGYVRFINQLLKPVNPHDGLLCAAPAQDGQSLITGGEDGKICSTSPDGTSDELHQSNSKWIDTLATGPNGAIAFASGRNGKILLGSGETREVALERTIEGLCFAPKGMRLAMARYDGVELLWVNTPNPNQFLEWKGAHTDVMFSPDGKYVVSIMQENALHGWRLGDGKHMRMSGYPAKVTSASWSYKGKWLVTSGAPAAIAWPFTGKDGPMGKAPKELGSMGDIMVTHVCCHPNAEMLAIGYANGMIMATRIEDGKIVSLKPEGSAPITTMGWDKSGSRLAFGAEDGSAGVIIIG